MKAQVKAGSYGRCKGIAAGHGRLGRLRWPDRGLALGTVVRIPFEVIGWEPEPLSGTTSGAVLPGTATFDYDLC